MLSECTFAECSALFLRYDIALDENQYALLQKYAEMLLEESTRQNETAVRTCPEIWTRHFLDSAYLLRFLPDSGAILDIGTGGGIPAIPLAILKPGLSVTMVDSELHKIEFCSSVISALGLTAKAVCGRAEDLAHDAAFHEQFDFVVSRAMASGSMLSELGVPFLKVGGNLISMKGRTFDPSVERFQSAADALSCELLPVFQYQLEGEIKHLIFVHKSAETPVQYPRRFAKIKRAPL